jgi:hypothetical protein
MSKITRAEVIKRINKGHPYNVEAGETLNNTINPASICKLVKEIVGRCGHKGCRQPAFYKYIFYGGEYNFIPEFKIKEGTCLLCEDCRDYVENKIKVIGNEVHNLEIISENILPIEVNVKEDKYEALLSHYYKMRADLHNTYHKLNQHRRDNMVLRIEKIDYTINNLKAEKDRLEKELTENQGKAITSNYIDEKYPKYK